MSDGGPGGSRGGGRMGALLLLLLVIALLAAAVGANRWKRNLAVKDVLVYGNRILTTGELVTLAGIRTSERLFSVDLAAARRRLGANPFVRSVSVNREIPDVISITVTERTPAAVLPGDPVLYVDGTGVVLPGVRLPQILDLPAITGTFARSGCVPGRVVQDSLILEAIRLVALARSISDDLYRRISEVHVEPARDILVYTSEAGIPVILGHSDLAEQLVKFDGFWKSLVGGEGTQGLQSVDLRFRDEVVVRWGAGHAGGAVRAGIPVSERKAAGR